MKLKQWQNISHAIANAKTVVQLAIQTKNNEACQWECKNYRTSKKDYNWNPSTCICENGEYLKVKSCV